jgi:hypothetical protein
LHGYGCGSEGEELFAWWLQRKDHESREEYKRKRRDVMTIIAECIREVNSRWGEQVTSEFRELKKIFWRSVNRKNKVQENLKEVKDENDGILHKNKQVVQR